VPTGTVAASPEYAAMLGYSPNEFTATYQQFLDSVHPDDRAAVHAAFQRGMANDQPVEHTYRRSTKAGDWVWISTVGRVIERGAGGQPLRAIGVHMDVSERKHNQEELARYRRHLEDLVAERTAQLSAAKNAAEAANVAKSAFLANMSHEIRTPLNAITGMTHLVRRSGVTPRQEERLAKIEVAGQHLLEIINDILDLSKIEAGKFVIEHGDIDLDDLLRNVGALIQDKARTKGLALVIDSPATAVALIGDATRLQQALLNYASNAVKFTEHGTITLRARIEAADAQGARVRFEVEDTGIGIAPEVLPKLFARAGRQFDDAKIRRHRPRPGDHAQAGGIDGRRRGRRQSARRGQPLLVYGAAEAGQRTASRCAGGGVARGKSPSPERRLCRPAPAARRRRAGESRNIADPAERRRLAGRLRRGRRNRRGAGDEHALRPDPDGHADAECGRPGGDPAHPPHV
jgi:hypothetical protein